MTGRLVCKDCPAGYYNDKKAQATCRPCAGTYNPGTGSSQAIADHAAGKIAAQKVGQLHEMWSKHISSVEGGASTINAKMG